MHRRRIRCANMKIVCAHIFLGNPVRIRSLAKTVRCSTVYPYSVYIVFMRKCFARSSLVLFLYYIQHTCAAGINPQIKEQKRNSKKAGIFICFVRFRLKFHQTAKWTRMQTWTHLMCTINFEVPWHRERKSFWSHRWRHRPPSSTCYSDFPFFVFVLLLCDSDTTCWWPTIRLLRNVALKRWLLLCL